MKIVLFRLSGEPEIGDLIILRYSAPRGGSTHVMHRIGTLPEAMAKGVPESLAIVANLLVKEINDAWMKEFFHATFKPPATVRIECQNDVDNVTFFGEIEGSEGVQIEIEEA